MNIFAFYKVLFHCSTLFYFFCLHRPLLLQYGLFDQLRVDHGTEFCLCSFVQELLKNRRGDTSRAPWRQTTSTKNHRAERLWPEENARINYPLKRALNFIKDRPVAGGGAGGAQAPPQIFRLELNSATKVEFFY